MGPGTLYMSRVAEPGRASPPIFDLRTQTLRADNRLLRSLSRQTPQSYFRSATTDISLATYSGPAQLFVAYSRKLGGTWERDYYIRCSGEYYFTLSTTFLNLLPPAGDGCHLQVGYSLIVLSFMAEFLLPYESFDGYFVCPVLPATKAQRFIHPPSCADS